MSCIPHWVVYIFKAELFIGFQSLLQLRHGLNIDLLIPGLPGKVYTFLYQVFSQPNAPYLFT